MAMCPFAKRMMLTEPLGFRKGVNGDIQRIVVHHTGVRRSNTNNHAYSAWNTWTSQAIKNKTAEKKMLISAHFVIEEDGTIVQLIDTADIGFGTAAFTGHAVHLEHAGNTEPFTRAQLHASAMLIAWVKMLNAGLSLNVVGGADEKQFGDDKQKGITCHAWSDGAAIHFKNPSAPKSAKLTCPGQPMLGEIPRLADLARSYAFAVPTLTSPEAVAATSFFDWSSGSPVSY